MSKIILAGGGNAQQSSLVDRYLSELEPKINMICIPQAGSPKRWSYEKALDWIHQPTAFQDMPITMWKDISNKTINDLEEFNAIYVMGGNTYELLSQLKKSGFLSLISEFLDSEKIVYGISAGAYILGRDIRERLPFADKDKNAVGLQDLSGLDLLNGHNVHCHYTPNHDEHLFNFEKENQIPLIAIPETSGVAVENNSCEVIGFDPVCLFTPNGEKITHQPGSSFCL
jgi:dipeptidase E